MTPPDGGATVRLAIDTATTEAVIALGDRAGDVSATATWEAGHRHGETLLPAIGRLLDETGTPRSRIEAIIVGTGPGAFTGLRVGIATAKGLAHGLGRPLVGVRTGEALLAAAAAVPVATGRGRTLEDGVLLLPAGPSDRTIVRHGVPALLLRAGTEPELAPGEWLVAVDLDGRAPADALVLGQAARAGLAGQLVRIGTARLVRHDVDELTTLVPEYVTPPRGAAPPSGEMAWSHDRR